MTKPVILDAAGRPMKRQAGLSSGSGVAFDASDVMAQAFGGYRPLSTSPDAAWLPERDTVVGRTRDIIRNSAWANSGVQKTVDAIIGSQFRLSHRPDAKALGIDPDDAATFASQVEALWRVFAEDPRVLADVTRVHTVTGLLGLAYRHYLVDGDAMAHVDWDEDSASSWSTCFQIIDPDRVSNPHDAMDEDLMRRGVELNERGAAIAYHVRNGHEFDWPAMGSINAYSWERIERETDWGRAQFVHFYDKHSADQHRGIPKLATVVATIAMEHRLEDLSIQAAAVAAALGLFFTSPFDHEQLAESLVSNNELSTYQDQRAAFHEKRQIKFDGTKIPILFPGEQVQSVSGAHPHSGYEAFQAAILRKIASGLGISYEQLTGDWSKTNYSSARAALVEVWRGWTARRADFAQRFVQPLFMAWLEETIDRGYVELPKGAPRFWLMPAAWVRASWIGPGRGWVDPVKEADGAGKRLGYDISTQQEEAAEQGKDYEEILDQKLRERKEREARGLPEPQLGHNGGSPLDQQANEPEERRPNE